MRRATPGFLYVPVFLYVAVSLAYLLCGAASLITGYYDLRAQGDPPFSIDGNPPTLTSVKGEAVDAGLKKGDQVESIDGVALRGLADYQRLRWYAAAGETWTLAVRGADGSRHRASVALKPFPKRAIPLSESIFIVVISILIPGVCLGIGYWVVFARPRDPNAWLVLILLTYPEIAITVSTGNWWPGPWLFLRLYWHMYVELAAVAVLVLLGLRFPERSRIDARLPWLKWLVVSIVVATGAIATLTEHSRWYDNSFLPMSSAVDRINDRVTGWTLIFSMAVYWIAIFDKLRTASTADARRRMRVLCIGSVIGLASVLIVWGVLPLFGIDPAANQLLGYASAILLLAFPFSLAYVVIVQRAMDVTILVRMGTRYLLARATLVILQIAILAFVLTGLVIPLLRRHQEYGLSILLPVILVGIAIRMNLGRRSPSEKIREWLDRRFFREQYDSEKVLGELAERVRRVTEPDALVELICTRISAVLHVPQLAVMLRQGDVFALASGGALALRALSSPVRHLTQTSSPAVLYRDKPAEWFVRADSSERATLDELSAEVLIPLPGRERLMGVMVLGPKLSEEPYSASDLRLLQWVAIQAGMGLEVNELAQSLAKEAAQHQRIQREVEIAREVQERLFPQYIPALEGVELAGHCRPALGVGGDYYDMIPFEDGKLGLAIGDVSGKGIAAALLMASLRASLRGMTADGAQDLAKMMRRLNRLVYEASAVNRYATFFFALYDPATRQLRYVNGGHNPPFIVREREVLRLEAGGPVVGLLRDVEFQEDCVQLRETDLFVGYTDGISEAMTADDEEWGEERLLQAVPREASASGILEQIFASADAFTAGAEQHDDMTVLVMKLQS